MNLFICGESYSNNQGWIEGALETTNNRRNSNNLITIRRSAMKKVKKQFKDSNIRSFNLIPIPSNTFNKESMQLEMRKLYDKLLSYSDFSLVTSNNFNTKKGIINF